jgi:hypothetical protein
MYLEAIGFILFCNGLAGKYPIFTAIYSIFSKTWSLTCYLMGVANQCAISITNSVVWPLVIIAYEKLHEIGVIVYDSYGKPVVNVLHKKYQVVEDTAFIYVIGPSVKTLLDNVPEKNPFCSESDSELDEFLPEAVGDANIPDEEDNPEVGESSDDLLEIHDDELDDLGKCKSKINHLLF